jgi:hypothetical protein
MHVCPISNLYIIFSKLRKLNVLAPYLSCIMIAFSLPFSIGGQITTPRAYLEHLL